MPSTTTYSFGDVVLVPFPFTDQSTTKKRPAVVVSSDAYNRARPDVIVMAVTGHMSAYPRIGEVVVSGWKEAGLLKLRPSSRFSPIENGQVIRAFGKLKQSDSLLLKDALKAILGR